MDTLTEKQPLPLSLKPLEMTNIEDVGEEAHVVAVREESGAEYAVHIVSPVPQHGEPTTTVPYVFISSYNTNANIDDV